MLDDLDHISKIDKSGMIDTIYRFPEQIKETVDIINPIELENCSNVEHIIVSGMGGSAISGDIIQCLFRDKLDIPIFINREYTLPKWANNNTLVITISYSGNTEETLNTFKVIYYVIQYFTFITCIQSNINNHSKISVGYFMKRNQDLLVSK